MLVFPLTGPDIPKALEWSTRSPLDEILATVRGRLAAAVLQVERRRDQVQMGKFV
jgi:hypothetical protein